MKTKRLFVILIAGAVALSLCACGGGSAPAASTPAPAPAASAPAPAPAPAAEPEGVSDENWEILQQNYQVLVEAHDRIAEIYNSDEIKANPEIEDLMGQAFDLLTEMGDIDRSEVTEDNAETLNNAMMQVAEALDTMAEMLELAEDPPAAEGDLLSALELYYVPENLAGTTWDFAGGYIDGTELDADGVAGALEMYGGKLQIVFDSESTCSLVQGGGTLSGGWMPVEDMAVAIGFDNNGEVLKYAAYWADFNGEVGMALFSDETNALYFVPAA